MQLNGPGLVEVLPFYLGISFVSCNSLVSIY